MTAPLDTFDCSRLGPGSLIAVVGPRGSGKTTLIKDLLSRLAKPEDNVVLCSPDYPGYARLEYEGRAKMVVAPEDWVRWEDGKPGIVVVEDHAFHGLPKENLELQSLWTTYTGPAIRILSVQYLPSLKLSVATDAVFLLGRGKPRLLPSTRLLGSEEDLMALWDSLPPYTALVSQRPIVDLSAPLFSFKASLDARAP